MKLKESFRQKNVKWVLAVYVPVISLIGLVIAIIVNAIDTAELQKVQQTESHRVTLLLSGIDESIDSILSDLRFLSNAPIVNELLKNDAAQVPTCVQELGHLFLEFSTHRKLYDQIRFLDAAGMEVVRVNYNNGRPLLVPPAALQNKKDRYYFADTFALGQGEVFVSPLDLNIEHGQIEEPLKPMLRVGTPVFNQAGVRRGIIVMNYFGAYLIRHIHKLHAPHDMSHLMLLNSHGFWLKSPNPEDEWGFMYEDRKDLTFAAAFPFEWQSIQSEDSGQLLSANGLFSFSTAYPLLPGAVSLAGSGAADARSERQAGCKDYKWKIVSWIPKTILEKRRKERRQYGMICFGALALPLLFLANVLGAAVSARRQAEQDLRRSNESLEAKVALRTEKLQKALEEVKTLRGIIPICSYCKKIRDDEGAWRRLESYISAHSDAKFSHGACPECCAKLLDDLNQE